MALASCVVGCSSPPGINHGNGGSGGTGGGAGNGSGGSGGTGGSGGSGALGDGGSGGNDCPANAKLVYIIDQDQKFSSFLPNQTDVTKSIITDLGTLACPTMIGGDPFSMSVDRNGTAWVEYIATTGGCGYAGGELFTVSTNDVSMCSATNYMSGQQGFEEFGMGFVSTSPGADTEQLFIGGGKGPNVISCNYPASSLGTLDVNTLTVTPIMSINGRPELTGTGDATLWGFFPDAQNPRISQLDKTMGTESNTIMLPTLKGMPTAWAFAFYGGDFFVFLQKDKEKNTTVYHVVGATGAVTSWALPGRTIVGAGVSTCAPTAPIS